MVVVPKFLLSLNVIVGLDGLDLGEVLHYDSKHQLDHVVVTEDHDEAEVEIHEQGCVSIRDRVHKDSPVLKGDALDNSYECLPEVIEHSNPILHCWIVGHPIVNETDVHIQGTPTVESCRAYITPVPPRGRANPGEIRTFRPICSI